MPTAKQQAASRANAQKSTGPRTSAGKAVSRFNALKHGIYAVHQVMFDEKAEDLAELAAEYHEHHNPANPNERLLVDTLVHNEWRLRRMRRVEVTLKCTSGDAFATDSSTFERLQRMVNSCERIYHRALKELQRLQAQAAEVRQTVSPANPGPPPQEAGPAAVPQTPQPQEAKPTSTSSASVGNNSRTPPKAGPVAQSGPGVDPTETQTPTADLDPNAPDAA